MKPDDVREQILRRHASQDEEFARRIVVDREFFEAVLAEEQRLTDEYLGGRVDGRDRADFERLLKADPDLAESVEMSRGLEALAAREGRWREPAWRGYGPYLVAAAVVCVCTGALGLGWQWQVQNREHAKREVEWQRWSVEQRKAIADLEGKVRALEAAGGAARPMTPEVKDSEAEGPRVMAVLIQPDIRGNATVPEFRVAPEQRQVELRFVVPPDLTQRAFEVTVERAGGGRERFGGLRSRVEGEYRIVSIRYRADFPDSESLSATLEVVTAEAGRTALESYHWRLVRR